MADLMGLIAKLEALDGPSREVDAEIDRLLNAWTGPVLSTVLPGVPPVTASIDAAVALCERALPGTKVMVNNWPGGSKPAAARIGRNGEDARGPTLAIALVIALLRAMEGDKP